MGTCCREFVLTFSVKPWTHNAERRMHRYERAALVRQFRDAFGWLAKQQKIPTSDWLHVVAVPYQRRGPLQDVSACHPAVKAAIDGLVDTGVVPDDTARYVPLVAYMPAVRGDDALELRVFCHEGGWHGVHLDVSRSGGHHDGVPHVSDVRRVKRSAVGRAGEAKE